jgi:hypothetical protein
MGLAKHYSPKRLEAACARALIIKAYSFKSVESILKKGLDQQSLIFEQSENSSPLIHQNIRGKNYYN